jgi:hypothetical protein
LLIGASGVLLTAAIGLLSSGDIALGALTCGSVGVLLSGLAAVVPFWQFHSPIKATTANPTVANRFIALSNTFDAFCPVFGCRYL